jgi:hypothetical protein
MMAKGEGSVCVGGFLIRGRDAHTFVGDDGGYSIARGYIRSSEWDFPRTSSHKRLGGTTINGQGVIGLANAATFNVMSTVGGTPAIDFTGGSSAGTAQIIL